MPHGTSYSVLRRIAWGLIFELLVLFSFHILIILFLFTGVIFIMNQRTPVGILLAGVQHVSRETFNLG